MYITTYGLYFQDLDLGVSEPTRLALEETSMLDAADSNLAALLPDLPPGLRVARVRSRPSEAVVAALLDAVRTRIFQKTVRTGEKAGGYFFTPTSPYPVFLIFILQLSLRSWCRMRPAS